MLTCYCSSRSMRLIVAVILILLPTIATAAPAFAQPVPVRPISQNIPCVGGADCPPTLNPQPDEYYTVQCATNSIWIWQPPNNALVTIVPLIQVVALGTGESFIAPQNVTVTIDGDTVILSGENGRLAPEPGEKSFSWNECIARNGGLPEIPRSMATPNAEQAACLDLPSEQEIAQCLANLSRVGDADPCTDGSYASENPDECRDSGFEILLEAIADCLFPLGFMITSVVSLAGFRINRKRRSR